MGILDGRVGYNFPMTASTRAMRFLLAISMRLWAMYDNEQQRVCSLWCLQFVLS